MQTHESYLAAVQHAAIALAPLNDEERTRLESIKLVYGSAGNVRGVTFFDRWQNGSIHPFVEISAFNEENPVQLAGTLVHELGHVLATHSAGHRREWKIACNRLGLRNAKAKGHIYLMAGFKPELREAILRIPRPDEGQAVNTIDRLGLLLGFKPPLIRGCGAGVGTMGGKSRGPGSGSRLRLWTCDCIPPVKVRVASDQFAAHCDHCEAAFRQPD